jgi:hypothetical protein
LIQDIVFKVVGIGGKKQKEKVVSQKNRQCASFSEKLQILRVFEPGIQDH